MPEKEHKKSEDKQQDEKQQQKNTKLDDSQLDQVQGGGNGAGDPRAQVSEATKKITADQLRI